MRVTAITHKRSPVFTSIISQVTPSESSVVKKVAYEPMFLAHLRDQLSIRSVLRVSMHEPLSNLRPVMFVQFARGALRTEVWRALQGAATLRADCGKIVIGISEDIDPESMDAVFWSLAYRSHPAEDVQITRYRRGVQGSQYGPGESESTMLIDATQKYPMAPARAARPRIHGAGKNDLAGAGVASTETQVAVARLYPGRLDRGLGDVCTARGARRMGAERHRDVRTHPRRSESRNARSGKSARKDVAGPGRHRAQTVCHGAAWRLEGLKPAPFKYHDPRSIADATALLASLENARVLAGGQSLMPMMNFRYAMPDHLVDLNRVPELSYIRFEGGRCT
jgi:3-polyprenyl-4-hydroxybenzoate decarboxylase